MVAAWVARWVEPGGESMAMGRRNGESQGTLWVATGELPRSPGHVFYVKLNALLADAGFDEWVEALCQPYYAEKRGRPGIPPGVYFRMLFVGYFEGIGSQRGIAWRCADSLSLRTFLGMAADEESPDHSSLTIIRNRLSKDVHTDIFQWVLTLAREKHVLNGKTLGVDSTTLEANAAMKSIVRKDSGDDWRAYLTKLMQEEGVLAADETPTIDELVQFDKRRKKRGEKKVSNEDWVSETDPSARIAKMKDGTTHLAYKAEHAVDLETEMIVAAEIYHADETDTVTLEDTVNTAQIHLHESGSDVQVTDVVADKGYHANEVLETFAEDTPYRTYLPEPKLPAGRKHVWTNKPEVQHQAYTNNRRRTQGDRGKRLQRQRSEQVERTFAHVCETGGARRTWLRGIENVRKRSLIAAVAHNLGRLMRALFGMGTPRGLQKEGAALSAALRAWQHAPTTRWSPWPTVNRLLSPMTSIFRMPGTPAPTAA